MKPRPNGLQSLQRTGAPPQGLRAPPPPKQIPVPETSAALGDSTSQATDNDLTTEELIARAKQHIGVGETSRNASFRAAAYDMALAHAQGAKQRDIAKGVGKSVAWVNRLLKWQETGYVGAPFADKVVQGVNKDDSPPEAAPTEPPADVIAPSALAEEEAPTGEVPAAPVITKATNTLSDASLADYHLPQVLNRQDPEGALQRLAEQWRSSPFRHFLLDSPQAAQLRFLRDVVLPEVGGLEIIAAKGT
jgi:hypothetical protein